MNTFFLLIVYCTLIAVVSLLGGRLSSLLRLTHLRTQLLMSAVGGLMLGIAMLHLLPHATESLGSPSNAGLGGLVGLVVMFLLVRLFHTHDHSVSEAEERNFEVSDHHHCNHNHEHDDPLDESTLSMTWVGLFFGLVLHTLVDGIALSASVIAESGPTDSGHGAWMGLGGLGTFLAVALHKPLDAFAITSVMSQQNWSTRAQRVANGVFSVACPVGALSFYFGVSELLVQTNLLGWGLALSAGFFIGIALADLLPEVAFHDHDRGKLTATFLLGIALALGIEYLPGHSHEHGPATPSGHHMNHSHHQH